jgi:hypothetical protein
MSIYRHLMKGAYSPDETRVIAEAYENAVHVLRLVGRADPVSEIVANKVIEIWEVGERDAFRIAALAFEELGQAPAENPTAQRGR